MCVPNERNGSTMKKETSYFLFSCRDCFIKTMLCLPVNEHGQIQLDARLMKDLFLFHHGFAPTEHDEVRVCIQEATDFPSTNNENPSFFSYAKN